MRYLERPVRKPIKENLKESVDHEKYKLYKEFEREYHGFVKEMDKLKSSILNGDKTRDIFEQIDVTKEFVSDMVDTVVNMYSLDNEE